MNTYFFLLLYIYSIQKNIVFASHDKEMYYTVSGGVPHQDTVDGDRACLQKFVHVQRPKLRVL